MRHMLVEAGIPAAAIRPEDRSTTTAENIRFALPLIPDTADVVIVTDGYHAPRALLIARRLGLNARTACPGRRGANPRQQIKSALREIPAYLLTLLRPGR